MLRNIYEMLSVSWCCCYDLQNVERQRLLSSCKISSRSLRIVKWVITNL